MRGQIENSSDTIYAVPSRSPKVDYDYKTNSGEMFNYFTYGAAISEVQIDTLSGDHVVGNHDNVCGDDNNKPVLVKYYYKVVNTFLQVLVKMYGSLLGISTYTIEAINNYTEVGCRVCIQILR